jgi:hypothetical protein
MMFRGNSTIALPAATIASSVPAFQERRRLISQRTVTSSKAEEPVGTFFKKTKRSKPKYGGHLSYSAPDSYLARVLPLPPKRLFFWFGKEPIATNELQYYLTKYKEAAFSTIARAAETGEGLLLFSKTGSKSDIHGVFSLADVGDIKAIGTSDFYFKLRGVKHKFDARNSEERDWWVAWIVKTAEEAEAWKDEILASKSYKVTLAKLSMYCPIMAS